MDYPTIPELAISQPHQRNNECGLVLLAERSLVEKKIVNLRLASTSIVSLPAPTLVAKEWIW